MQHGQSHLVLQRLLARIRDVMAGGGEAEERLNQIVSIIAEDMMSDVCSIYVRRAGDVLELFATRGLSPAAVHSTRLRLGEGLVGEIAAKARPLALTDPRSHPSFVFRRETGEEIYESFMGVPIVSGGRILGVLAVQDTRRRRYTDEEIEALQTVAMVLAELIGHGRLVARDELFATEEIALRPTRMEGIALSVGIGMGVAVVHEPRYTVRKLVAEDTRVEHERLREAVADMHGALDNLLSASDIAVGGEHRDVLETYRLIAEDVGWLRRIGDAINNGLTAEAAVQKVDNDMRARMGQVSDPYLRERVHDLEDLANRLLQHLIGADEPAPETTVKGEVILVARSMGPAQLLDYDRTRLRGVVLEEGSPNAHVAIVARALDIPVIGQAREAVSRMENGDPVIVDADHGQVFVRPGEDVRQAFAESLIARDEQKAVYSALRDLPAVTLDGTHIGVSINAGLLVDLMHLSESGADGVGLYRTEVPFMVRSEFPDVDSQVRLYQRILGYADGKPVIFRTLDVGGDKVLPYWDHAGEENPAMGWRAMRVSLDRPAMLRQQLRALIRASSDRDLKVMFPMIARIDEFEFGRHLLEKEIERESGRGTPPPRSVSVGAMLEVPALVFQLDALLERVDFLSVGTNDLFQFMFASDRASLRVSERYDSISPVVLSVLRTVVNQCDAAGVPLSVCGEMAGRPLDAMALIGIGVRNISMPPSSVGPVKTMIRSLQLASLEKYMETLYDHRRSNLRHKMKSYAQDHGVMI